MPASGSGRTPNNKGVDPAKAERIVAEARLGQTRRETTYREQALRIYPWICGRCAREFTHATVRMLTVHHKDHNHDNNPPDGSNWELLCLYCHDNEHSRQLEKAAAGAGAGTPTAEPTSAYKAFAGLDALLKGRK
jgi:hypothetical protein